MPEISLNMLRTVNLVVFVFFLETTHTVGGYGSRVSSCTMRDLCSCFTSDGQLVNLQHIGHLIAQDKGDKQDFRWEPCNTFNIGKLRGVTAAQHVHRTGEYYDIGTNPNIDFTVVPGGVIQITMVSQVADRMSYVNLTCTSGKTEWIFKGEHPTTNYNFELRSPYACPGYKPPTKSSSISTGSIMVIIFFILLILYLGIGIIFLVKVRNASGLDAIPNKDLWFELPGLIMDGCLFTASLGKRRNAEYSKL